GNPSLNLSRDVQKQTLGRSGHRDRPRRRPSPPTALLDLGPGGEAVRRQNFPLSIRAAVAARACLGDTAKRLGLLCPQGSWRGLSGMVGVSWPERAIGSVVQNTCKCGRSKLWGRR